MINVLVVEKDWRMSELLMNILTDAGYSVDEARDGRTAIERAGERRTQVAVFSQEVCAREFLAARATRPALAGVAVLVASTRPKPLDGAAVYLKKPFAMDDLLAALHRCLELGERGRRTAAQWAARAEQPSNDAT